MVQVIISVAFLYCTVFGNLRNIADRVIFIAQQAKAGVVDRFQERGGFVCAYILIGIGCNTAVVARGVGIRAARYSAEAVIGKLNTVYLMHLQGGDSVCICTRTVNQFKVRCAVIACSTAAKTGDGSVSFYCLPSRSRG